MGRLKRAWHALTGKGAVVHQPKQRGFEAAQVTRINRTPGSSVDVNVDIKAGLGMLRKRSRDLVLNDPYARKYLKMLRKYVVGPDGLVHRNKAVDVYYGSNGDVRAVPDRYANRLIQDAFWKWSKREYCTIRRDQSLRQALMTLVSSRAVDGEVFILIVYDKRSPFGFTLQFIEGSFCDDQLNTRTREGNVVVMGIEYDPFFAPVAYYFKKFDAQKPMEMQHYSREYIRIPADRVIHYYQKEFTGQLRGYPDFTTVANRLHHLKGYEDAALVAARSGASKTNILEPLTNQDVELTEADVAGETGYDEAGEEVIIQNIAPGETYVVPDGYKYVLHDPAFPQGEHAPFTQNMLYGVSSGFDVDYPTLSSNLSNVNYTSTRHGLLDARLGYRIMQRDLIETVLEPIHSKWLESAILRGYLKLPMAKLEKFDAPVFYAYRGDWVDPLKDTNAKVAAHDNLIESLENILGERGIDLEEHLDQLAAEKAELEKRGLEKKGSKNDGKRG